MNLIGISGFAGSGKDTVADWLVREKAFVKLSLADPIKRICKDVFDFSDEQLWGPSEERSKRDKRYPRFIKNGIVAIEDANCLIDLDEAIDNKPLSEEEREKRHREYRTEYLTPRHALQQLGTEWGRACYNNVWVDYTIRTAKKLLEEQNYLYDQKEGLRKVPGVTRAGEFFPSDYGPMPGVVIPDVRFKNEVEAIREAGGKLVRVVRPKAGLEGEAASHQSEREMALMGDELFDLVIQNDSTLDDLFATVAKEFAA